MPGPLNLHTGSIQSIAEKPGVGIILGYGVRPDDGMIGFAPGAILIDENGIEWRNMGTRASALFRLSRTLVYAAQAQGSNLSSASTTQTTLASIVIPANSLRLDDIIECDAAFQILPGAGVHPILVLRQELQSFFTVGVSEVRHPATISSIVHLHSRLVFTGSVSVPDFRAVSNWRHGRGIAHGALGHPHHTMVTGSSAQAGDSGEINFSLPMTLRLTAQWLTSPLAPATVAVMLAIWRIYARSGAVTLA